MNTLKVNADAMHLLGAPEASRAIVSLFDLDGRNKLRFMHDQADLNRQLQTSSYLDYLHNHFIESYLRSEGHHASQESITPTPTLKYIFQVADEPRKFNSVSWQGRAGWQEIALVPDLYYFQGKGYETFLPDGDSNLQKWETRHSVFFWRGSTTGSTEGEKDPYTVGFTSDTFDLLPRYRMCRILQQLGAKADVGIVAVVQARGHEDAVTERLKSEKLIGNFVQPIEMAAYKFIVDIDGNSNAWNFIQRLRLGCCILKVESEWIQWHNDRVKPWIHYVPIKSDLSDLIEKAEWCLLHDQKAAEIAQNGRKFALNMSFENEMQQAALRILSSAESFGIGKTEFAEFKERLKAADARQLNYSPPSPRGGNSARLSFPTPVFLKTHHGTILSRNRDGALIQIPLDGDLTHAIKLSDVDKNGHEALAQYHLNQIEGNISLERDGFFLCALPDRQTITCDRTHQDAWETFTLIPA